MKEKLYRFEYDNPPWIVYVTHDSYYGPEPLPIPEPDRVAYVGEWELVVTEKEHGGREAVVVAAWMTR